MARRVNLMKDASEESQRHPLSIDDSVGTIHQKWQPGRSRPNGAELIAHNLTGTRPVQIAGGQREVVLLSGLYRSPKCKRHLVRLRKPLSRPVRNLEAGAHMAQLLLAMLILLHQCLFTLHRMQRSLDAKQDQDTQVHVGDVLYCWKRLDTELVTTWSMLLYHLTNDRRLSTTPSGVRSISYFRPQVEYTSGWALRKSRNFAHPPYYVDLKTHPIPRGMQHQ